MKKLTDGNRQMLSAAITTLGEDLSTLRAD
jgi:iron uptake system EfeUOB component EfeO/EfeM